MSHISPQTNLNFPNHTDNRPARSQASVWHFKRAKSWVIYCRFWFLKLQDLHKIIRIFFFLCVIKFIQKKRIYSDLTSSPSSGCFWPENSHEMFISLEITDYLLWMGRDYQTDYLNNPHTDEKEKNQAHGHHLHLKELFSKLKKEHWQTKSVWNIET